MLKSLRWDYCNRYYRLSLLGIYLVLLLSGLNVTHFTFRQSRLQSRKLQLSAVATDSTIEAAIAVVASLL